MVGQGNPVVELYELILQNPSLFGRLVYVARLWNPGASRYDKGLPDRFWGPETEKALARWHHTFFIDWLSLSLADKERDVALYWRSEAAKSEPGKTIRDIGETAIPPLVRSEERKFFLQDLTFIQALL